MLKATAADSNAGINHDREGQKKTENVFPSNCPLCTAHVAYYHMRQLHSLSFKVGKKHYPRLYFEHIK